MYIFIFTLTVQGLAALPAPSLLGFAPAADGLYRPERGSGFLVYFLVAFSLGPEGQDFAFRFLRHRMRSSSTPSPQLRTI